MFPFLYIEFRPLTPEEQGLLLRAVPVSLVAGAVIWMVIAILTKFYRNYLDVPTNVCWHEGRFYRNCLPWLGTQYDLMRGSIYLGVGKLISLPFMLVMAVCFIVCGTVGLIFILISMVLAVIASFVSYLFGLIFGLCMVSVDTMEMLRPSHPIRPLEGRGY